MSIVDWKNIKPEKNIGLTSCWLVFHAKSRRLAYRIFGAARTQKEAKRIAENAEKVQGGQWSIVKFIRADQ